MCCHVCRYVVVTQDDRSGADVSVALRRLRQAVVVSMLDAVPSVKSIIQPEGASASTVMSLGEHPDDLPCLKASTVPLLSLPSPSVPQCMIPPVDESVFPWHPVAAGCLGPRTAMHAAATTA